MFEKEIWELGKYSKRKELIKFLLVLVLIFVILIISLFARINEKTDLIVAQSSKGVSFEDFKLMKYLSTPRDPLSWVILRFNLKSRQVELSNNALAQIQNSNWDYSSTEQYLNLLYERDLVDSNQYQYLQVMGISHSYSSLVDNEIYDEAIHLLKSFSISLSPSNRVLLTQQVKDDYTKCLLEISSDYFTSIMDSGFDETSYLIFMRQYVISDFAVNKALISQYFSKSLYNKELSKILLEYKSIMNLLMEYQMLDAGEVAELNDGFSIDLATYLEENFKEDPQSADSLLIMIDESNAVTSLHLARLQELVLSLKTDLYIQKMDLRQLTMIYLKIESIQFQDESLKSGIQAKIITTVDKIFRPVRMEYALSSTDRRYFSSFRFQRHGELAFMKPRVQSVVQSHHSQDSKSPTAVK